MKIKPPPKEKKAQTDKLVKKRDAKKADKQERPARPPKPSKANTAEAITEKPAMNDAENVDQVGPHAPHQEPSIISAEQYDKIDASIEHDQHRVAQASFCRAMNFSAPARIPLTMSANDFSKLGNNDALIDPITVLRDP